jgi:Ion transport protein
MLKWSGEPLWVYQLTQILNYICTGIFTLEMFIKLGALGPKLYFRENWNRFDFFVLMITYAFIVIATYT